MQSECVLKSYWAFHVAIRRRLLTIDWQQKHRERAFLLEKLARAMGI